MTLALMAFGTPPGASASQTSPKPPAPRKRTSSYPGSISRPGSSPVRINSWLRRHAQNGDKLLARTHRRTQCPSIGHACGLCRRFQATEFAKLFDRRKSRPGQPAGAESRLEVVSADSPVKIEDFPGKIQVLDAFALHRPGVDFG